jgi:hypothetical protein
MYSNSCVLAVLVNNTPCSELANGSVTIPFNSEYSIRVRNKDKKRKLVAKIFVDGENISEGGVIVSPGSYVDVEGPVNSNKRFKFVDLESPDAVDSGKNGSNLDKTKGLIEAQFFFEKEEKSKEVHHHHHYPQRPLFPFERQYPPMWGDNIPRKQLRDSLHEPYDITCGQKYNAVHKPNSGAKSVSESLSEMFNFSGEVKDGCTVEGSHTNQSFIAASFSLDIDWGNPTVLKIFLQGIKPSIASKKQVMKNWVKPVSNDNPVLLETDSELDALNKERIELEKELARLKIESLKKEIEKQRENIEQ